MCTERVFSLRTLSTKGINPRLDRVAGLDLEEVESRRLDGELDRLALPHSRLARDPCREETALAPGLVARRRHGVRAECGLHVLAADRGSADAEVDEHVRAEVLTDVHDRGDRGAPATGDRRILEILRTHAEDDPAPGELRE